MSYALVTGPIQGRIPHGDGFVDVTPDLLVFDTEEERDAVGESVEVEQAIRGNHPLQAACAHLDDPAAFPDGIPDDVRKAHQAAHKALNKKLADASIADVERVAAQDRKAGN